MSQPKQWDIGDSVEVRDTSTPDNGRGGVVVGQRYNFDIKDWTSEVHHGEEIKEYRNHQLVTGDESWRDSDDVEKLAPIPGPRPLRQ